MFDNIGDTIKKIAVTMAILSIVIGIIWFLASIINWNEYQKLYNSSNNSFYKIEALTAKSGLIYSIILIICGTISSFLIYGFGELIDRVVSIDEHFKSIITKEKIEENKPKAIKEAEETHDNKII